MSKSLPVRRSERLMLKNLEKSHQEAAAGNGGQIQEENTNDSIGSTTRKVKTSIKSATSRREQLRLEVEMRKKELEHKHQQEMMDLELAIKLAKLDETDGKSGGESESMYSESTDKRIPNVEKWVHGKNPWGNFKETSFKEDIFKVGSKVSSVSNEQIASMPMHLSKILTRQSLPKDLPIFSGDPTEWPNFIFQYENTTAICGYTKEENQCRLQKCLKGHARKIVESLLILPKNTERVIEILRNRFGRPEIIIMMLLERIRNLPIVKEDRLDMLVNFADEVKNVIGTMETLDQDDHLRNPILLQELLNKLPMSYRLDWVEHISGMTIQKPKLLEFSLWLEKKASFACQISIPKMTDVTYNNHNSKSNQKGHRKDVILTTNHSQISKKKCICCEDELHPLSKCPKFISFSVDERWSFVTSKRICFSCLMPSHTLKTCRRIKICGTNNCTKPHHIMLHKNTKTDISNLNQNSSQAEVNYHNLTNRNVLLKIIPIIIIGRDNKQENVYALLDDASTVTLIDQDLADKLGLDGPQHTLSIQWTNHQVKQQDDSRVVSCGIMGQKGLKRYQLRHVWTMKDMALPIQTVNGEEMSKKYPYLGPKVPTMIDARPLLLIGQDNWPLLVNRKVITGPWNGPALTKTLLGFVIHGNVMHTTRRTPPSSQYLCHINHEEKDDLDILHDLVKRQWQIDCYGMDKEEKSMSRQDILAKDILDRTMKRNGERFETGLLWKDEKIVLPESRTTAMKRLHCTERKMDKNINFAKAYCDKMLDLEHKNYIRKLTEEEIQESDPKTWYLPHFGVFNPNKPKKLRIVFDAASKSNGVCINDFLLTGPDLYNSLYDILLNFRIKRFAFTSDIKEMFLQVQVRKEDRCAQRFLWRGMERKTPPYTYEIMVVFFGSTSGPCLAQEAKNRNAKEFYQQFPEASRAIIEDHYMDDYLGTADTEEEAVELVKQITYIHKKGGFVICNWIANSNNILEAIDPELRAHDENSMENSTQIERILGAWWNPKEDVFGFQTKFHKVDKAILENEKRPTKREVLKVVMSIFDPIGFIAHFLIQAKVLLQDIWRNKLDWDDEINDHLYDKWKLWLSDLKTIYDFKIPRQYFTLNRNSSVIQLHIFSDASEKCYGTVAYLRIENNDTIQTSFVTAKARVVSLKPLSIPRLELQAALMSARIGHHLKNNLKLMISKIYYWTDSKTVLHWIRSEAQRFKVFVAHRLGEIQDLTKSTEWSYVPSNENPADIVTKRREPLNISNDSMWFSGPKFLQKSFEHWPHEEIKMSELEKNGKFLEVKNDYVFVNYQMENIEVPDPKRFSKWNRLRRATAWVLRFINNCKKIKKIGELQVSEIQNAERLLYKKAQRETFNAEYNSLNRGDSINKHSRLYSFTCVLDKEGLIRLGGRLNNASQVSEDIRKPIILDSKHQITKLIIQHYHEELFHQGQEILLNNLRQHFWILRSRQAIKSLKSTCQKCKNDKSLPQTQMMGQLPLCRVEPTIRCFIKTGVDYFGPIKVAVRRSSEKRYGVIFTCMVTRAVHLEIAHDLSTNSFIHVLRQFICRRGYPEEIYSDNGSNLKSAEQELSKSLRELSQSEIIKFCTLKNIKWNFIPPASPYMGGAWERLIKSVKKIMNEMLVTRCPQEFVLRTVFAEIENILNSRPLTHVSIDKNDPEPLTPNHFLIGRNHSAPPCTTTEESALVLISRWKAAQRLVDYFWKRWVKEYLPFLVKRSKWFQEGSQVTEGDVVLILDPDLPRNTWPKGRVVAVYPGRDKRIRVVDVKTANGNILRRPITRLCVLDVTKNEE